MAEQRRKGRLAIGKDLLDEHCADISSAPQMPLKSTVSVTQDGVNPDAMS